MKTIIVAEQRTGHHAICMWAMSMDPAPVSLTFRSNVLLSKSPKYKADDHRVPDPDKSIHAFECFDLADLPRITPHVHRVGVVVRDGYNWMASLLAMLRDNPIHQRDTPLTRGGNRPGLDWVASWKQHVRTAINPYGDVRPISFNEWYSSDSYRIALAKWFGFDDDGNPYTRIRSPEGGGSFGADRRVLERWKTLQPNDHHWVDDEMRELTKEFFGMDCPWHVT